MDSPVEKGTAFSKSPGSAKKVRPTTPGVAPAQDLATKPAKRMRKKKPKMQELDDDPSKADSAQDSHSKLQEPQQVNNKVSKTPDAKNQSAPDVGGQDKFKALNPQGCDSTKKVIKKKKPSPPAQLDEKDDKPEQTQKPIDQDEAKKRLPAKQFSPDNLGQTDQLKKKAKRGTEKAKRLDSPPLNNEEPEKVEQLNQDIEKPPQEFKPSVSQMDDAPKIIKKKIKRPTPSPASESEPESEPEPEHDDEATGSEHEGKEETKSEHDNDMDRDDEYESDDENESEGEVEKAPEEEAPEEDEEDDDDDDDDDEDEHKHGREEEDRDDDSAKKDVLGKENAEKQVHDITGLDAVVAEPEKIFSYDVAQDMGNVSEADNASGQAQDKADDVAAETKGAPGKVQNAVGSLAKEGVHATEEAASKSVNDAGEVIDESGKKLGKATADYSPVPGNGNNDAGEITDAGEVVDRASQVEEFQRQAGISIKGFEGTEQTGSVDVHGIQINVQSTKDGVSVTINIPGVFQQQQ